VAASLRAKLRSLFAPSVAIDDPSAAAGAAYLASKSIPLHVASAGRVCFAPDWCGSPCVVFPVQDGAGLIVAAEGRRIAPGPTNSENCTAGQKSGGVFVALPGALEADGVILCESPIGALSVAACGFPAVALCERTMPPWLARQLARRAVFVSLDRLETEARENAAEIRRALVAVDARPYSLAPPDRAGDWNDYLQAVGPAAMCDTLSTAMRSAESPGVALES